ncbi:protein halfway [Aricia agestis]|uniref:protein halfway n=1 Tax=Aricia agestis TaxID=91739 RepID=UPI001C202E4C|nr:protein halfway [Aricia agestis]
MWNINRITDVLWCSLLVYLTLHVPPLETRLEEVPKYTNVESLQSAAPAVTEEPRPEPRVELKMGKCFHMSREHCPKKAACAPVDPVSRSVFCCDVDSFRLKESLALTVTQNTTNLHVLNATIDELDVSQSVFRRLMSMALTDGNIGKIVGQFPKHSSLACLNISNNNLSSATLQSSGQRTYAYLFNLTLLDASANNLTEFPLYLLQSNRKIRFDLSGNSYMPCKDYQRAMETSNSSADLFLNYNRTNCALDLRQGWFEDVQIVQIDHLRVQKELNASCREIRPAANCTCVADRLKLIGDAISLVAVDCSARGLTTLPTNLPANTVKLNVSYNNITSLSAMSDDPSYEQLLHLVADHNDIDSILGLEGTKFVDSFMLLSLTHNKLKSIPTYVLSNRFVASAPTFLISGNPIHCDCQTEKLFKPWLLENLKNIPDYKSVECTDRMGPVVELVEVAVCHSPRDWTDYIYYVITLEVLVLVLLISKVTYDYWVFKTAGYLPWPANKMPRLPCDWLCE